MALHVDLQDALARFARILMGSRSPTTVRLYVGVVRRWLAYGGAADRLDADLLQRWLADRRRQRAAPATINVDLKALRSFYDTMALIGACPQAESNNCPSNRRVPPKLVRSFDDGQVLAMLAAPDVATFIGYRDSVLMRTLWETGLLASELIGLGLGDVLPDAVYVAHGKGGRTRWVPISDELYQLLLGYMELRATTRPGKRAALWVSQRGQALRSRRSVWAIVSHWARVTLGGAVGYENVRRAARSRPWTGQYPHLLRASMATTLLRHGCPLTAIMQMLGHTSLESTARYLEADITHLRVAIAKLPRFHRSPSLSESAAPAGVAGSGDPPRRVRQRTKPHQ
ncbi:tyrosine-type recombinase/integrase [Rhodanobacter glycinis]|uniref:tyrosine-type recombinase/integrase n=1 Tax=Rhodanobacter glycinis TaxID=582702 RepID=UPI0013758E39|nr:tyrosine-type recombinase/integrase [Rhodanobacter glycinis]